MLDPMDVLSLYYINLYLVLDVVLIGSLRRPRVLRTGASAAGEHALQLRLRVQGTQSEESRELQVAPR